MMFECFESRINVAEGDVILLEKTSSLVRMGEEPCDKLIAYEIGEKPPFLNGPSCKLIYITLFLDVSGKVLVKKTKLVFGNE
jgi:hypothetical protein